MIKLNGVDIIPTIFPDKTSQVWHIPDGLIKSSNRIDWNFEHEGELFHLIQLCTLIRETEFAAHIELHCPYLPYARQHKTISNETTFALHVFCDCIEYYINSLHTFDVHNYEFFFNGKLPRWHFKLINTLPKQEIDFCINSEEINFVVFPDKSAAHRYSPLISLPNVFIEKVRDQGTGNITGMEMPDIPIGANILVVDDLADGGRSFIECAKLINRFSPSKLTLYVSHAIFSKGTKIIHDAGFLKLYDKNGLFSENPVLT